VVVVFSNSGANASELALSLLDLALGIRPLPPPKTIELTAAERAKYVGVYELPARPNTVDMSIFEENGGLFVQVQRQNPRPLQAFGSDTFGSSFDPTLRIKFTVENGKATKLTLTQRGQSTEAPRKKD